MNYFSIKILQTTEHSHNDLELNMINMENSLILDSYWFKESIPKDEKKNSFVNLFIKNLESWKTDIENLSIGKSSFLPINIGDQSTGFVVVKKLNSKGLLNIYYADSILITGSEINPWFDPEFKIKFDEIFSFRGGTICSMHEFLEDLAETIDGLFILT